MQLPCVRGRQLRNDGGLSGDILEKIVPVTFEVLEKCCSELLTGEEPLARHKLFNGHSC